MSYGDYDQVLQEIGECGLWQILLFLLLCIPAALSSASIFLFTFAGSTPTHLCVEPFHTFTANYTPWEDETRQYSSCSLPQTIGGEQNSNESSSPCSTWLFDDSIFSSTAVEDFQLVCDNSWRGGAAQTACMGGMLVGSLLCGVISDKIGRKPTLLLSLAPLLVGGFLPLTFPSTPAYYWLLLLARALSGFGAVGAFIMALCLALEYVGARYRVMLGISIQVPFTLGGLLVGLVSWAGVRDWKMLMLSLTIPNLFILFYWFILPESPRWLLAQKDKEEYERVIKMGARINKKPLTKTLDSPLIRKHNIIRKEEIISSPNICSSNILMKRFLVLIFNWMIVFLCYFGITMTSASFSDDLYLNYTLVFLVDLPSQVFCLLYLERCGRKALYGGSQILAGVTFLATAVASILDQQVLQVILTLCGKFGVSSSLAVMFVYTAELFPTNMRNTALGTCSLFARIGGMFAPQVVILGDLYFSSLPLVIMGVLSFLGGILILAFLPETLGRHLPDTVSDALDLEKPYRRNTAEQALIQD